MMQRKTSLQIVKTEQWKDKVWFSEESLKESFNTFMEGFDPLGIDECTVKETMQLFRIYLFGKSEEKKDNGVK